MDSQIISPLIGCQRGQTLPGGKVLAFLFQTETGPVSIPLICLIKRCAPRITSPHIDLGNMIIGQIQTFPLKMNEIFLIFSKLVLKTK